MTLAIQAAETFAESGVFLVDTSASRLDSDRDGMPDSYELAVGLNPFVNDATGDDDGDGLSNLQEYNAGSGPFTFDAPSLSEGVSAAFAVITRTVVADTDGDGLPDSWETANGLNVALNDAGEDPDGDGLTNLQEYNAGTSPHSNDSQAANIAVSGLFSVITAVFPFSLTLDSDGDGMPDWWEQKYGLNPFANDANGDKDGDGVVNLAEYRQGDDPANRGTPEEVATVSASFVFDARQPRLDSDGDGIPDAWELAHNLDPQVRDASQDPDRDGRTNLDEYNAGTDPQVDDGRGPSEVVSSSFVVDTGGIPGPRTRDSDGDGIPDWWEVAYGLNPNFNDSAADADGDGLSNLEEFNSGSNPNLQDRPSIVGLSSIFLVDTGGRSFDTDSDGLPDWWEKLYFNDPRAAEPLADNDGDGQSNAAEFAAGSNPREANSVFRIESLQAVRVTNGTQVIVRWASFEGMTYSIWTASVVQGRYTAIAAALPATPPVNTFNGVLPGTNGFVRLGADR